MFACEILLVLKKQKQKHYLIIRYLLRFGYLLRHQLKFNSSTMFGFILCYQYTGHFTIKVLNAHV